MVHEASVGRAGNWVKRGLGLGCGMYTKDGRGVDHEERESNAETQRALRFAEKRGKARINTESTERAHRTQRIGCCGGACDGNQFGMGASEWVIQLQGPRVAELISERVEG